MTLGACQIGSEFPKIVLARAQLGLQEVAVAATNRRGQQPQTEQQQFLEAYLNPARVYMLQQEKEKARKVLLALLKVQPEHKLAQQALEMLN